MEKNESGAYLVETPEQLVTISQLVNTGIKTDVEFELPDELDMAAVTDFQPIGTNEHVFDGKCNVAREYSYPTVIRNLVINLPEQDYVGLFGKVATHQPMIIRGIILDKSCKVTGHDHVGGLEMKHISFERM